MLGPPVRSSLTMTMLTLFVCLNCMTGSLAGTAIGQTVTVTISDDVIDIDPSTGTIADLPGPDGKISFSEAMIATNNTPGHQTVGFAIPVSDWKLQFLYPGRAVLTSITGYYFRAFDEVTIDGTTQTAFTGDTNPDGNEVVIHGEELYLNADDCTLLGFDSTAVSVTGSNGLVQGNTGTMNITVFGGSGSLIQGNTVGTIKIDRSNHNVVVGNTVQRVRVLGFGSSQPALNNRIGGPNPEDRNFITGYGTWNSEGLPSGTTVQIFDTTGTRIENNWIGTTPDGLAQGSLASNIGISLEGENFVTSIRNNRIAGILGHGQGPHHAGQLFGWAVLFAGSGSDIAFMGNTVGLDANDQPVLGSVWGLSLGDVITSPLSASGISIGGLLPGEGNEIAGHIFNGVTIGRDVDNVRISGNAIYDNGWLGIDLVPIGYGYGVTQNDPLDGDDGGNGLQNHPDLYSALREGSAVRVLGTLHSSPSSFFTLEFFASPECDPSGFGEGQLFLGSASVSTDGAGDADFDVKLPGPLAQGWFITSTAVREPLGATSEFSACVSTVWRDEGGALAGAHGEPSLVGTGTLAANEPVGIHLGDALENAAAYLVAGVTAVNLPFYGGTMVPAFWPPYGLILPAATDGSGEIHLASTWPAGVPSGTTTYFQYWIADPAGPLGFSASNALSGTAP